MNTPTGVIYDNSGYLMKMNRLHRDRNSHLSGYKNIQITKKTMFHVYIGGESKLIVVGRRIIDVVSKNRSTLFDLRCNDHLLISKKMVNVSAGMVLPSYDGTSVISSHWNVPVDDINSKEEWIEYLRNNQPSTEVYDGRSISKNRDGLIELFGVDLLSEVIQGERNKKLNEILN